ncbi:MAG: ATP synthase F1 subunit gamma [Bacilli bacterium]
MQSLSRVKRRINTVQSTRKITNSMKLVSSVKLRKLTKFLESEELYFTSMDRVINDALFENKNYLNNKVSSPYLSVYPNATKTLYIVVTSNTGLCAGYNANIFKFFKDFYKKGDEVILIGEKSYAYFRHDKELVTYNDFIKINTGFDYAKARLLAKFALNKFGSGNYKSVNIIYTKYINSLVAKPENIQILPYLPSENPRYHYEPIYEPGKQEVVDYAIPLYIASKVYYYLYISFISEESSRRNAMDNADRNAKELVDELKLEYNKARQAEITQQITEVTSGSMAVK